MAHAAKPKRGRGRGRGVAREPNNVDIFGQQKVCREQLANGRGEMRPHNAWTNPPLSDGDKENRLQAGKRDTNQQATRPTKSHRQGKTQPQPPAQTQTQTPIPPARTQPTIPTGHTRPPAQPQQPAKSPELEDDSSSEEEVDDGIVNSILKAYGGKLGNQGDSVLTESRQNLQEACQSGANDCSVCLSKIRRVDAVWTCDSCFTSFHLQCIQKWAKEGILQASLHRDDDDDNTSPVENRWSCPNCRTEYPISQCPRQYTCFCKKVVDPPLHPWLAPHSCGDTCNRSLRPECGHKCLLLCHPGACPPCPQTVRTKCHCGCQPAQLRRCSSRTWSCGKTCSKVLLCGQHTCTQTCHAGECPPCPHTSQQQCLCKKKTALRECASPRWECGQACGKPLPCGHHLCERMCHEGECGECPRKGLRKCPCGKTALQLQCTEDIPPCGDTCDKPLPCGVHRCTRRCHTGPCESCLQMSRKKCRCGAREKMLPCQEEYKCDHRCTKMKACKKHQCKRRCCSGECPPCEQQCNKYLPCGNHKCPSLCHPGRCFPCPLMVELKCRCGHTKLSVRCGREKSIKPPKCKRPCKIPPDCHHPFREKHLCHFDKCPPCKMQCNRTLSCGHTCPKKCHDAVVHKTIENAGPRAPWQPAPRTVISIVNEPCPPCQHPVPTECLGKHEISDLPCSRAAPFSCTRPCGRLLACTNHHCQFECHDVVGAEDKSKAGTNCQECEEGCSKERPEGCKHHCRLPCHPGPCPPCKKTNKMRCHCKAMALYVECNAWIIANDGEREELASCKGPCPRPLSCSHPCSKPCHAGPCSDPKECTFKVPRRCQCKRRKKDFLCHEAQAGKAKVECDDVCKQQKDKKVQQEEEKAKKAEEERLEKEKRDLEEYNRLTNKRKKTRKRREFVEEETFMEKHGKVILIGSGVTVVIAFIVYLLLLQ